MKILRTAFKYLTAILFIMGGMNHFLSVDFYLKMMPTYLPMHLELVYLSGVIEIILGVGLLISKWERKSAISIVLLLLAVFPANIHMYLNPDLFPNVTSLALLIRLPMQFLFIGLVWVFFIRKR